MKVDEQQLHAFLDGELAAAERRQVQEYLDAHPHEAARIAQFRADAETLRQTMLSLPPEPATLFSPAAVRRSLRRQRRQRYASVAMLLLAVSLGWGGGWLWHQPPSVPAELPMRDALEAYRLFSSEPVAHTGQQQLSDWFRQYFSGAALPPLLEDYGLQRAGAELMATADGPAAMVLYRGTGGETLVYFVRPGNRHQPLPQGQREEGALLARYWSDGRFNYALVSPSDSPLVPVPGPFGGTTL